MAMTKRSRSVTTTPHNPEVAEYRTVTAPARMTTSYFPTPNKTPPILMAARVTVAMIITLKNTPR